MKTKLTCKECGATVEREINLDGDPACVPFTCKDCTGQRSMTDGVDYAEIGKTELARQSAWQHAAQRYAIYKREKDRASKFKRRNGFTLKEWHARVDQLGWACSFCGRELTPKTVLRRSEDGSKSLRNMIPICRSCHCKKIGREAHGEPLSGLIYSSGRKAA